MGEALQTWEMVVLGAIVIALLFFAVPGLRQAARRSRSAEKDWPGFLLPIGAVILFVILLIMIV